METSPNSERFFFNVDSFWLECVDTGGCPDNRRVGSAHGCRSGVAGGGEPSMPSPNGGEISGEIQELADRI